MDKSNTDLSVIIRHFEVHNRTEGKSLPHGWMVQRGARAVLPLAQ